MATKKKTTKTKQLSGKDAIAFVKKYQRWYKRWQNQISAKDDSGGNPSGPPPPPPGSGK